MTRAANPHEVASNSVPVINLCIPCYNPTSDGWVRLAKFVEEAREKVAAKIVVTVVDDGSPRWIEPQKGWLSGARVIRQPVNKGKGGALRAAAELMNGEAPAFDVFAFTDYDVPYSVENFVGICAAIVTKACDVCIGDRTLKESSVQAPMRVSRLISHHAFRFIVRTIVAGGTGDTQCGLKAYRASVAGELASLSKIDGFLFDLEWIYIALHHKLAVLGWPVDLKEHHESSKLRFFGELSLFQEGFTLLRNILSRAYESPKLRAYVAEKREAIAKTLLKGDTP